MKKLISILFLLQLYLIAGKGNIMSKHYEKATLGGGCFWCLEAVFENVKGVEDVISGYSGGLLNNPTYEAVCSGTTGHAEVVQITYDPTIVSFKNLLEIFWKIHDPTTLNRQGADIGTQYRSVIFYHDEKQKKIAEESKAEAQKNFSSPIVTEISPLKTFWKAEDYHQDYFKNNPNQGYCQVVVAPKVEKFQKTFKEWIK